MTKPRRRRIWYVLLTAVVVLGALVALLPTFVNLGLGRGAIEGALAGFVNGTVALDDVHVSWTGPLELEGFRVRDGAGREAANLHVTLRSGLIPFALGAVDTYDVTIGGALAGAIDRQGRVSLADLVKGGDAGAAPTTPPPSGPASGGATARAPGVRAVLDGIRIELAVEGAPDPLVVEKLTGEAVFAPGGTTSLTVRSPVESGARRGDLDLTVTLERLFDEHGAIHPAGAAIDARLAATNLAVPLADDVEAIERLELTLRSADAAQRIDLHLDAVPILAGAAPSALVANLALIRPLREGGALAVGLDTIEGSFTGTRVPTALAQPALAGTGIILERDVGPTIDVAARFAGPAGGTVELTARGDHLSALLEAALAASGAVDGRRLEIDATVAPALVKELAGADLLEPVRLSVRSSAFRLPPRDEQGRIDVAAIGVTAEALLQGPVRISLGAGPGGTPAAPLEIAGAAISIESSALGEGASVTGEASALGGEIALDARVEGLVAPGGAIDVASVRPAATLELRRLSGPAVAALLTRAGVPAAAETIGATVVGRVQTTPAAGRLSASLGVETERVKLTAAAQHEDGALVVSAADIALTVTPALVAALAETPPAYTIMGPVAIQVDLAAPVTLRGERLADLAAPERVEARVTLAAAQLTGGALAAPLEVTGVSALVEARLAAKEARVRGEAAAGAVAQRVECDVTVPWGRAEGAAAAPAGRVVVSRASAPAVERLLGWESGRLSGWTGAGGDVTVSVTPDGAGSTLALSAQVERGSVEIAGAVTDAAVRVDRGEVRLNVAGDRVAALLVRARAEDAAADAAPPVIRVPGTVPIRIALEQGRIPRALLGGAAFAPADVAAGATLTIPTLPLLFADGRTSAIRDLEVALGARDLARGATLRVDGLAGAEGGETGQLHVEGTVANLVNAESKLDVGGATVTMRAEAAGLPSEIADALLGMRGRLALAIGPSMSANVTSDAFSPRGGRLESRLDATNGFLHAKLIGEDGTLRTDPATPITAELRVTPELRQAILEPINPIFKDVRTVEQPIRVTMPRGVLPMDGDVSRLEGHVEITTGAVELDSGSTMLFILSLFKESDRATLPGFIEPIVIDIHQGVVTYDRFAMKIDKYTLAYQGTVDLVKGTLDLRTEVPLEGLAMSVEELRGYADRIIVPIVTRGTLKEHKTEMDPEFDLGRAALDAGFKGALGELLGGEKNPIGDILGDIFGRKKKPKEPGGP
jgi:hypothetical protein